MHLAQAEQALAPLLVVSDGWTDDSVEFYTEQLAKLPRADLLKTAVLNVSMSWRSSRRPPLAEIMDAYRAEARRAEAYDPMLPPDSGRTVSGEQARALAAQAYLDECKLHGNEPNWPLFDRIFGRLGGTG